MQDTDTNTDKCKSLFRLHVCSLSWSFNLYRAKISRTIFVYIYFFKLNKKKATETLVYECRIFRLCFFSCFYLNHKLILTQKYHYIYFPSRLNLLFIFPRFLTLRIYFFSRRFKICFLFFGYASAISVDRKQSIFFYFFPFLSFKMTWNCICVFFSLILFLRVY